MDNRIFGYVRVSSADQNLDRQLDALGRFPVQQGQIYADKASGKNFRRPQYQRLLRRLREGDVLVIKSIDRLGCDYREVLDEWRRITVDRRAAIVVLDMPLLDTREQPDGITGTFMADLVLQILSYVAQLERENIKQRQAEGIASARLRGVRFGRPALERPDGYNDVIKSLEGDEVTRREAATPLNVSASTFDRWRRADTN
ncbi:recombinase family protein [Collinsella sp. LCP19S3_H3]|uniref:recombinase family protein n=1 Tax=Collinsella sp. LCP19S3_H3 TaxID=3438768 RepID=UPI003F8EDCC5